MTPEQIKLVQESFAQVLPIAAPAARLFYGRLFHLDASLELLFTSDMEEQGRKLMTMIRMAVNSLDRLETILPTLQTLGARHVAYGVCDRDYDTVGAALLWTLQQGLGEGFTPAVEAAWRETYITLATAMRSGATINNPEMTVVLHRHRARR